jgi:aspartyl-tRNA(Asn)/glutamyl-tRNA(Gln) amidotransferase subunit A
MTSIPLTVTDAADQLRAGKVTSVELTTEMLARADALDPKTGTYLARFDDYALAKAEEADKDFSNGVDKGPYQGVPIGIKDILAMAEGPTTANSLILEPAWGEGKDGPVVARKAHHHGVRLRGGGPRQALPDPQEPLEPGHLAGRIELRNR